MLLPARFITELFHAFWTGMKHAPRLPFAMLRNIKRLNFIFAVVKLAHYGKSRLQRDLMLSGFPPVN
jgi:hypothetical protein